MTAVALISFVCHVLHIASTCTSLGGLFYARMVLWPTLDTLAPDVREQFLAQAIRRFAVIKWTGVAVVAVTGIVQWVLTFPHIINQMHYILFFGIKMIGAVGLFSITFLLAMPTETLRQMRMQRAFWAGLNIICGLTILVGAALMHSAARR
ncbi:MAG: hypothetical protein ABIY70_00515 [Capsulimonas sp.]|uniref:hypothetical protein n=1 Tax=Capsulimonas sp. TaxID=2494211 RepID=UPI0032667A5D